MKLKSLLTLAVLATSTSLSAEVVSDSLLCRIAVHSGTRSTIVAVPLKGVNEADNEIAITEFVLTDNLGDGAVLMTVKEKDNTKKTYSWVLNDGEWQAMSTTYGSETTTAGEGKLQCGSAAWIVRAANDDLTLPFYIYGRECAAITAPTIATAKSTTTTVTPADGGEEVSYEIITPAYTLIGNSKLEDWNLNSEGAWSGCKNGDEIIWDRDGKKITRYSFTYDSSKNKWGYWGGELVDDVLTYTWKDAEDVLLPAGQGFWYVSKTPLATNETAPSLNW